MAGGARGHHDIATSIVERRGAGHTTTAPPPAAPAHVSIRFPGPCPPGQSRIARRLHTHALDATVSPLACSRMRLPGSAIGSIRRAIGCV